MSNADEKREKMLAFIRDTLIERAYGLRTGYEANSFVYCETPEGKAQLKRILAVEAAADVFTHLVGEWQKEPKNPDDPKPGWLRTIVNQGMATFIEGLK